MTEPATNFEKLLVIGIFGMLAAIAFWKGNTEAAVGFASTLGTYAMSREGV